MVKTVARAMKSRQAGGRSVSKRAVVNMINSRKELKLYEYEVESTGPVSGTVEAISQPIIVGDTSSTRDGNQINMKQMILRLEASLHASAVYDKLRIVLVSDRSNNGAVPAVLDILSFQDPNSGFTPSVHVSHRFKILYDGHFVMTNVGSNRIIAKTIKLNLGNHVVNYLATTSTAAANGNGSIFMVICTDEGTNVLDWHVNITELFYDS